MGLRAMMLALDIGGTKIAAGLVSPSGVVLCADRRPSQARGPADALFADVVDLAERVLAAGRVRAADLDGIGVGCGGPMRYPEGRVSTLNIPAWRDFPLRERLADHFSCRVVVDNDAKALVLAEAWIGAGQEARCLMGMTVSTGVGGGIVVDGRLLHGASGNAGHIGHVIAFRDGPPCECGALGCVEAVASGTGLAKRARAARREGLLPGLPPEPTGADVVAAARAGEPTASRLVEEAGIAVGRGIAAAAVLLDLDRVAIGGSVALGAGELFLGPLRRTLATETRISFMVGSEDRVVLSSLGSDGPLVGAAALLRSSTSAGMPQVREGVLW
ncbi:MAG: ROK family protein [Chloroflexi bacterium]|nr:ROK family protein [Chloroflexota bacterium]